MKIEWTKEFPKQPGLYWAIRGEHLQVEPVEVELLGGEQFIYVMGTDMFESMEDCEDYLFSAQKIELPEKP